MAMGHTVYATFHFGAEEHPCTTYFDVHQAHRVLTHNHIFFFGLNGDFITGFRWVLPGFFSEFYHLGLFFLVGFEGDLSLLDIFPHSPIAES